MSDVTREGKMKKLQCFKIVNDHGFIPDLCVLDYGHEEPCSITLPVAAPSVPRETSATQKCKICTAEEGHLVHHSGKGFKNAHDFQPEAALLSGEGQFKHNHSAGSDYCPACTAVSGEGGERNSCVGGSPARSVPNCATHNRPVCEMCNWPARSVKGRHKGFLEWVREEYPVLINPIMLNYGDSLTSENTKGIDCATIAEEYAAYVAARPGSLPSPAPPNLTHKLKQIAAKLSADGQANLAVEVGECVHALSGPSLPSEETRKAVTPQERIASILEKCEFYWNRDGICDAEVHAMLERIHEHAREISKALAGAASPAEGLTPGKVWKSAKERGQFASNAGWERAGPKPSPRCPKCGGKVRLEHHTVCDKVGCWDCGQWYAITKVEDFAQFFTPSAGEPQP